MQERHAKSILDVTGLLCPLPVLKAGKMLRRLPPGAVLEVHATDPMSAIDFPHFCSERGYILLDQSTDGTGYWFTIQRPQSPGARTDDENFMEPGTDR